MVGRHRLAGSFGGRKAGTACAADLDLPGLGFATGCGGDPDSGIPATVYRSLRTSLATLATLVGVGLDPSEDDMEPGEGLRSLRATASPRWRYAFQAE